MRLELEGTKGVQGWNVKSDGVNYSVFVLLRVILLPAQLDGTDVNYLKRIYGLMARLGFRFFFFFYIFLNLILIFFFFFLTILYALFLEYHNTTIRAFKLLILMSNRSHFW